MSLKHELTSELWQMYSMMNYAAIELGTWYPMGGMHEVLPSLSLEVLPSLSCPRYSLLSHV